MRSSRSSVQAVSHFYSVPNGSSPLIMAQVDVSPLRCSETGKRCASSVRISLVHPSGTASFFQPITRVPFRDTFGLGLSTILQFDVSLDLQLVSHGSSTA